MHLTFWYVSFREASEIILGHVGMWLTQAVSLSHTWAIYSAVVKYIKTFLYISQGKWEMGAATYWKDYKNASKYEAYGKARVCTILMILKVNIYTITKLIHANSLTLLKEILDYFFKESMIFFLFYVKMFPRCLNNPEIQALRMSISLCLRSSSCWEMLAFPVRCFPCGIGQRNKIRWYFPAFVIASVLTRTLAEIQPQIMTEPPPCFTDRHSLL